MWQKKIINEDAYILVSTEQNIDISLPLKDVDDYRNSPCGWSVADAFAELHNLSGMVFYYYKEQLGSISIYSDAKLHGLCEDFGYNPYNLYSHSLMEYKNGILHGRLAHYNFKNELIEFANFKKDQYHGAIISFDHIKKIKSETYYIEGDRVSKADWEKYRLVEKLSGLK